MYVLVLGYNLFERVTEREEGTKSHLLVQFPSDHNKQAEPGASTGSPV